jgi:hypothetical protein
MPVNFEDFVGAIVNDGIPRRCPAIPSHENAALELESENGRRLGERYFGVLRDRSYMTYGPYVSHSTEQPNEILSSASGRVHHWPVRWR